MSDNIAPNNENAFDEVISIIDNARENAFRAVNRELIGMYWDIGEYISRRVAGGGWGKSVVREFSEFIQSRYVGIKGFSPQNIWRMKQFYETYNGNEKLSTLLRELPWSHNMHIMSCKTDEEREFYLTLAVRNRYSFRELKRQMDSVLFERTMLSDITNDLIIKRSESLTVLRDSYVLEFLDLPESHREIDLRKAIVRNLKDFILVFGKDFAFVGEEYRVQVGNRDFFIDLLFSNRELQCLVAIELKIGEFEPEHLGKMEFYLEALDRDMKKASENPSVGLILCTKKDASVVEYALSRSLSPAMIADYKLHLPDKRILENKLRELTELAEDETKDEE
ncbi:MAG: PDDEXK nuclease domain-containing protein [Synergistaceae bacterium]|jgi:predicted nuclease of restriction endonuclease-like (RecB) superfamily|nr:PDDEXK nuclease domain-containing protein [Synergistaceae bacterium]